MKDPYKSYIEHGIWVAIVLFIVICIFAKVDIAGCLSGENFVGFVGTIIGYAGESITITSFLMIAFNKHMWKWRTINKYVNRPILASSYKGTIVSDWNKENKEYEAELKIRQTYLNVYVELITSESRSHSILATINTIGESQRLVYIYQNEPRAEIIDKSPMHKGTADLYIEETGELDGSYYTLRGTRGSMHFKPKS